MIPDSSNDPTRKIERDATDPVEIARQHRDDPPDPTYLPDSIGPYKILEQLGSGGMGLVYLAQQTAPDRVVAIKIIPPGRRTKEILARFDIEREALAMMDHPNIAKVFDAGASVDGRPYFVMEYVRGISITDYCDKNKLNTNERLNLFMDVCRAVHHAHQKGIIHRDIKPGNVLVGVQENRPIAKVIDFGVAKAMGHRLTLRTVFTEKGQLIGTPGYMSPEQAEMSALDIDTRTDIYSLGVLLYELLVGAQPFDTHKLMEAGFHEIQRVICEVDPPKPSTKLSSLGEGDSTAVASNRRTAVRTLTRELRGDLDWITMKCLEKDRVRRYDSASALAEDVERHMRGLPVLAGPPSAMYKMRKFVRRHRFGVAAGLTIAAALIAGFVGTTIQYYQKEAQRIRADYEAETAKQVNQLLIDLFRVPDPSESLGATISVREILDRGATRISRELTSRPLVQATMLDSIGEVYCNLGLYKESENLLRQALEVRRREHDTPNDEIAESLHHLGVAIERQERYVEAEKLHQQGLEIRETLYGRRHPATTDSLSQLAVLAFQQDRRSEAAALRFEVLETRRALLPANDPRIGDALLEMGKIEIMMGEARKAQEYFRQAMDIYASSHADGHPRIAECELQLANSAYRSRDFEASYKLYEKALVTLRTLYGTEDISVTRCMNGFATLLTNQGELDRAEPMIRAALEINRRRRGTKSLQVASDLNLLGSIQRKRGNYSESERFHRESLAIRMEQAGPDHEMTGVTHQKLGECLAEAGLFDEAERELLEAVRIFQAAQVSPDRLNDVFLKTATLYKAWEKPDLQKRYEDLIKK